MARFGISFNEKHSYTDMGMLVVDRFIGVPDKIKNKERVPHSNQVYDFSGLYGGQEYEERNLAYVFELREPKKVNLDVKKTQVLNWLMGPNEKVQLRDDYIPGYFFLAEVEGDVDFSELAFKGTLTVNFTAYPFRISEAEEGNDEWDTFNFLLDVAQITKFDIQENENITLYNPGVEIVTPKIVASSPMNLEKNGNMYSISAGETHSTDFVLSPGENEVKVSGNGAISFHFRKELI